MHLVKPDVILQIILNFTITHEVVGKIATGVATGIRDVCPAQRVVVPVKTKSDAIITLNIQCQGEHREITLFRRRFRQLSGKAQCLRGACAELVGADQ